MKRFHTNPHSSLCRAFYCLALIAVLALSTPLSLLAISNSVSARTYSDSDIVSNVAKRTGVQLPETYRQKVEEFVRTNSVMNHSDAMVFTEDFIVERMKEDWGISKENQLLFIWSSIHKQITHKEIYKLDDGDDVREEEFEEAIDFVIQCGNDYSNSFKDYMQRLIAAYKERSEQYKAETAAIKKRTKEMEIKIAEIEKSTEELRSRNKLTRGRIMQLDTTGIKNMVSFYDMCQENPEILENKSKVDRFKEISSVFIKDCKEYNIDYKAIIMEEVRDRKKMEAILKFYGIE